LHRHRRIDVLSGTLWWTLVLPLLALGMLALWSDRAEPHWIAPALLPLSIHIGRSELISKRLARACLITGALFTLAVWASVKTNVFIWLANSAGELFGGYQPRYDLTNDLHAWGPGRSLLQQAVQSAVQRNGQMPTVVGTPHWMICAQAQVAVGKELAVGCYAVLPSDFDRWMPRQQWHKAHTLLLVQDSRYPVDVEREFPSRRSVATWRTQVRRGSHVVRTIHITELENTTGTAHWFDANHSAAETLPALGR
jgi:hypothetical protein